jgi:hypothetical protein
VPGVKVGDLQSRLEITDASDERARLIAASLSRHETTADATGGDGRWSRPAGTSGDGARPATGSCLANAEYEDEGLAGAGVPVLDTSGLDRAALAQGGHSVCSWPSGCDAQLHEAMSVFEAVLKELFRVLIVDAP